MARPQARRPVRGRGVVVLVALAVIVGGVLLLTRHSTRPEAVVVAPTCTVTAPSGTFSLTGDQARYAATIAAVGGRDGLPDHAVSVAVATALQESQLLDLPYGDRDSVGLFQQRPSQGWGTRTELLDPVYAANAFYQALVKVPGWIDAPVTVAAQDVQRSGAPSAYAAWAQEGRAVAEAFTGEVAAGIACAYTPPTGPAPTTAAAVAAEASTETGGLVPGTALATRPGWRLASWLVARGYGFDITRVSYDGRVWTPASGRWTASGAATPVVRFSV